ncbi:hypothetical protein ABZU92_22030 [Micromonospora arida]|uniref:hypothetical protein n=1 Tax=Micromonospora arida TaxID=2203715 RepID=UPI0033A764E7
MSVSIRMVVTLVAAAALVCGLIAAPDYLSTVHAARAVHGQPPAAPMLMMIGSLLGLLSWVSAVSVQWRNRQFGWIVASIVLSYVGVITYAVLTLSRPRPTTVPAGA